MPFPVTEVVAIAVLLVGTPATAPGPSMSANERAEPVASTSTDEGGTAIGVDFGSPISLERQISWGMIHASTKITTDDLRSANAGNKPRLRETISSASGAVDVTQYEKLDGPLAVRYLFSPRSGADGFVALTSFEELTTIDREMGRIDKTTRLFHLEYYARNGQVRLLAVYQGEPLYDPVKRAALTILDRSD